ncbi:MAG: hypothetical protein WDW36_008294 [Sanguina aurantia]
MVEGVHETRNCVVAGEEEEEDGEVEGADDESSLALLLAYDRLQVGRRGASRSGPSPPGGGGGGGSWMRVRLSPHGTAAACLRAGDMRGAA